MDTGIVAAQGHLVLIDAAHRAQEEADLGGGGGGWEVQQSRIPYSALSPRRS